MVLEKNEVLNPFRPGAGHQPPYLAGRTQEMAEFTDLLIQDIILENLVLTGLRGVGKTVLLEKFKPIAIKNNWFWIGTDLSESASIDEEKLATRLLTDLSVVTSNVLFKPKEKIKLGFGSEKEIISQSLNFDTLFSLYNSLPGLVADKLKGTLEKVWDVLKTRGSGKIIFAYDEAQTMSNHPKKEQYPLSLLLDVFQSLQKKNIPFMLVLVGLPTLFPKLVDARTFAERMFKVIFLDKLTQEESLEAITKPIEDVDCPIKFKDESVHLIWETSGGYPYFIQFMCKEVFDIFLQRFNQNKDLSMPMGDIIRKLDRDFFSGRWAKASDRQRDLLSVIAKLPNCNKEFTVQDAKEASKKYLQKPISASQINQMFLNLSQSGLIFKNRHGKYSFAVPLLGDFISRQYPVNN